MFKVIIAGSRGFYNYHLLKLVLDKMLSKYENVEIVSGGANGADKLGEIYAKENELPIRQFIPDWSVGKHAGYIRNSDMADYADALIAFWDGKSRGTMHMINLAKSKGLKVKVVKYLEVK